MIRYFLLLPIIISICSCAAVNRNSVVITKIEYQKGNDFFKSKPKLFTREMCGTDDVRTRIKITEIQIEQIGDIAESSGFFDLSRKVIWPPRECLDVGPDSFITIIRGKKKNTFRWGGTCVSDIYPTQLSSVIKSLDDIIYNDTKVKNRPSANCPQL